MKKALLLILIAAGFLTMGPKSSWAETAIAKIKGTAEGSPITGEATFTETPVGVEVVVTVQNAPPGKHGFHIHENGSCADLGNAAGGHFNPDGVPHGYLASDGFEKAHAGDFGNIEVGPDGIGALEDVFIPGLSLKKSEKYSVPGRAVILHEKEDDFGQPTGNAGSRIGCGIIELVT